jgi:hypothetical protein
MSSVTAKRPALQSANSRSDEIVIAQSPIHGFGIVARRTFVPGDVITTLSGLLIRGAYPIDVGPNWVGIGPSAWIDPDAHIEHLNHCCAPNSAFGRKRQLVATDVIGPGEEITIDYSTTECDPNWSMACACGASNCRNQLFAIQYDFIHPDAPPTATPLMQLVWRNRRQAMQDASAFPQLVVEREKRLRPL